METVEQDSIIGKPSLFKKVLDRLFPRHQIVQTPLPMESSPVPNLISAPTYQEQSAATITGSKAARETRMAAYAEAKAQAQLQMPLAAESTPVVAHPTAQPQTETHPKNLPSGFQEVRRSDQTLSITQKDLPWLDQELVTVSLAEITLAGSDRQRFYYGSVISGAELINAARQLDEHRSRIANNLLYSHLPPFIRYNDHSHINVVDDVRTERPIYNVSNPGGQRVYFMRFDQLQGMPVIIRVAVCDKDRQAQVLSVLTKTPYKTLKHIGRLN